MIYGIIVHRGNGKHAFIMRQHSKFKSAVEEQMLAPYIVKIIEEETGDSFLLAEKIATYVREHHLEMEMPIDLTGISRSACLSAEERTEMLETSVRVLARKLEEAEHRIWELEYAHWCAHVHSVSASYELEQNNAIIGIAQRELECEHISEAALRYEQYQVDNLQ